MHCDGMYHVSPRIILQIIHRFLFAGGFGMYSSPSASHCARIVSRSGAVSGTISLPREQRHAVSLLFSMNIVRTASGAIGTTSSYFV